MSQMSILMQIHYQKWVEKHCWPRGWQAALTEPVVVTPSPGGGGGWFLLLVSGLMS